MNLVWFRSDLRVDDNRALFAACHSKEEAVAAIFFVCHKQWNHYGIGANQRHLQKVALENLQESLKKLNIPLIILEADWYAEIPSRLSEFCEFHQVDNVFFNIEYPSDERQRDKSVVERLQILGIKAHRLNDQTLVEPWSMSNQQGNGFKVFTPFSRLALTKLSESAEYSQTSAAPKPLSRDNLSCLTVANQVSLNERWADVIPTAVEVPNIKETSVNRQLMRFSENAIQRYHDDRDIPSINGTSELSSALAIGTLSIRRCYQAALAVKNEMSGDGAAVWIKELIWRDFYRAIMWHYPHVCRGDAFLPVDKRITWSAKNDHLAQWQSGTSGIPIVDAAIRQLLSQGWMHNRLRMVVASFLCKNLWFDWRDGERFFATHLFDYDFASNNGGWQWSASVGTDAAPYFRVFNPASQGARFDPNAEFIRKWLPELSNYSAKQIHNFEKVTFENYDAPIVDLKVTRKASIEMFKAAKENG